jgi:hypothetical protein
VARPAALGRLDDDPFVAEAAAQDVARRGVHLEMVRVHGAGHDSLAEARARVDEGLVPAPGDGVGREEDARDGRLDHPLDDHGELDALVVNPIVCPVGHRPVRP